MEVKQLEEGYAKLLRDETFDILSVKLKEPNIFKVLGVSDYEIRHSHFLAWLLDPNESHGVGDYFLNRFLQDVFLDERAEGMSLVSIPSIDNKKVEVRREWKNIDILVITEGFVVCIENKIWSGEHGGQLKKYKKIIEDEFKKKPVYVFLSPHGAEASLKDYYINYSYESIIDILDSMLNRPSFHLGQNVTTYIQDYVTILKQNLMGNDNINELAEELYRNHHELFDFVFQNKPDHRSELSVILKKEINQRNWVKGSKSKNYVRFSTPAIQEIIKPYENRNGGWSGHEPLLFEFGLWSERDFSFKLSVAPGDLSQKIKEVVLKCEDVTIDEKKEWITFFKIVMKINYSVNEDLNSTDFKNNLNAFNKRAFDIVKRVEEQISKDREIFK